MNNRLSRLTAATAAIILLALASASCNKRSINGKLDGMWQIMTIEDLATGEVTTPDRHYIDIYLHTVNLAKYGGVVYTANMTHADGRMSLEFPYNKDNASLIPWGIYSGQTTFDILKVNGKSLELRSDRVLMTLRRF